MDVQHLHLGACYSVSSVLYDISMWQNLTHTVPIQRTLEVLGDFIGFLTQVTGFAHVLTIRLRSHLHTMCW